MSAVFLTQSGLRARHGFFTRQGGVSEGPYASLNASFSGGDDPDRVRRNRALAAEALGCAADRLLGLHQVHGTAVAVAETPWREGEGPQADALVSAVPGLALGVVTADCAPVLLHDARAGVAGAAHAGWRGAAAGVLEAAVAAMLRLGATRAGIAAAIGPCIGQASYEVGADLRDAVLPTRPDAAGFFAAGRREAHWQFDLAGYCQARLAANGVRASVLGRDTCAEAELFFSHRRRTLLQSGPTGHQISIVVV